MYLYMLITYLPKTMKKLGPITSKSFCHKEDIYRYQKRYFKTVLKERNGGEYCKSVQSHYPENQHSMDVGTGLNCIIFLKLLKPFVSYASYLCIFNSHSCMISPQNAFKNLKWQLFFALLYLLLYHLHYLLALNRDLLIYSGLR